MIITLNDEDVQWDAREQASLGDLLEDFVKKRFFKDEFISSLCVNGDAVAEGEMGAARARPAAEITSLQISTQTFRNASINALESIGQYMDELAAMVAKSAEMFRASGETEANTNFVACIDGLQTFVGVIGKIRTLNGLDFAKMTHDSRPVSDREERLLQTLNSIYETQKRRDYVSMADILEFELAPPVLEWKDILFTVMNTLQNP